MSRKYFTRALVWALLIVVLSVATFYIRVLVISPLNNEIDNLSKQKTDTEQTIKLLQAQLISFNKITYDSNDIALMVPDRFDLASVEQDYVLRPVMMFGLKLKDFNITDGAPTNLNLSKDIESKKVSVNFTIEKNAQGNLNMDPLYKYINELYDGQRSVYFGNFSYKLPGEIRPGKEAPSSIEVSLEYYLFNYKTK